VIKAVEHIAVMSTDAEKIARFYIDTLGFQDAGRLQVPNTGTLVFVELNGVKIEFFSGGQPAEKSQWGNNETGYKHLCLLAEEVKEETARLKSFGVEFVLDPTDVAGLRVSFFKDPDGNVIELLQHLD
jgi:catechol 2,3-dioxygenase-like lactoylglutathione lyase family enzyme